MARDPSRNHYYLHSFGENVRKRAVKKGVLEDFSTRLGLVYGAFFGLRVLHDPRRYTRQGQVKDDVERSLRYWHLDGKILRFMRYGAAAGCARPHHQAMWYRIYNWIASYSFYKTYRSSRLWPLAAISAIRSP